MFTEIILRLCFPLPELSNFNRINYQILRENVDQTGYLRNIKMTWKSSLDTNHEFIHDLNRYGFRDKKDWEQEKTKKRILFLGDSFVEGMMSTDEETIPQGFENEARKNGEDFEVFNAGMMGIGFNEYLKFIKDALPLFQPDELILVLYSNDAPFQRPYQPNPPIKPEYFNSLKPRLLVLIEQIKKNDPIPFVLNREKRPFYKAVPDPGNPWTFKAQELAKDVSVPIAEAMKKGDFNYFRTNWILEEEKFFKVDIQVKDKLQMIKEMANKYACKLSVYFIPSRSQVSNFYYQFERQACLVKCPDHLDLTGSEYLVHRDRIMDNCNDLGIKFQDLTPVVKREENRNNHLYWNYDDHMKGKSYLLMGREIYHSWKK